MAKERGLVMQVWRSFVASLKFKSSKARLVGEDYHGTKYYEDPAATRRGRIFIPVDKENFEQEVPAEWEAWLRYRRREPPTTEEVNASYELMMLKKSNAAELEIKHSAELEAKYKKEGKPLETPKDAFAFPTYDEYQNFGRNDKSENNK